MCDGVSVSLCFLIKQGVFEQFMSQRCVRLSIIECMKDKESFDLTVLEIRKYSCLEIFASD